LVSKSSYIKKKKCLIVGAYPAGEIFGGFVRDCQAIKGSQLYQEYSVLEFDSSQRSNPPPHIAFRVVYAFIRMLKLIVLVLRHNISVAIVLFPCGLGALEKLFIGFIVRRIHPDATILYLPRAGKWASEVINYPKFIRSRLSGSKVHWLCQGKATEKALLSANTACNMLLFSPLISVTYSADQVVNSYKNGLRFIFVGWLEKEKGILDLLSAVSSSAEKFHLDIVGNGTLNGVVEEAAKNDSRITFHGWKVRDELFKMYLASHCLILPSHSEGFPNAVAEAMLHKCALIVSDVGDISGIVEPTQLIQSKSPEQIANQIALLVRAPKITQQRGLHNYEISKTFGIAGFDQILKNIGVLQKFETHLGSDNDI
jgi:glycosyltransferase involved in cell wall biosynthesis